MATNRKSFLEDFDTKLHTLSEKDKTAVKEIFKRLTDNNYDVSKASNTQYRKESIDEYKTLFTDEDKKSNIFIQDIITYYTMKKNG